MNFLGNKRSEKVSLGNGFSEKIQLYENVFQLSWVFISWKTANVTKRIRSELLESHVYHLRNKTSTSLIF